MKKLLLAPVLALAIFLGSWSDGSTAVRPADDCVRKIAPKSLVVLRASASSWSDGSRFAGTRGVLRKAPKCGGAAGLYWFHQQPGNTHWGGVCYNHGQSVWMGSYWATCYYRW